MQIVLTPKLPLPNKQKPRPTESYNNIMLAIIYTHIHTFIYVNFKDMLQSKKVCKALKLNVEMLPTPQQQ